MDLLIAILIVLLVIGVTKSVLWTILALVAVWIALSIVRGTRL